MSTVHSYTPTATALRTADFSAFLDEFEGSGRDPQTQTPDLMVSIDALLASTIDGHDDMAQCFFYKEAVYRYGDSHTADGQTLSGTIVMPHVYLLLKKTDKIGDILNLLFNGGTVAKITIKRLVNTGTTIGGDAAVTEYEACNIMGYANYLLDYMVVSFRVGGKVTWTATKYNKDSGSDGSGGTNFDFSTNKTE